MPSTVGSLLALLRNCHPDTKIAFKLPNGYMPGDIVTIRVSRDCGDVEIVVQNIPPGVL